MSPDHHTSAPGHLVRRVLEHGESALLAPLAARLTRDRETVLRAHAEALAAPAGAEHARRWLALHARAVRGLLLLVLLGIIALAGQQAGSPGQTADTLNDARMLGSGVALEVLLDPAFDEALHD